MMYHPCMPDAARAEFERRAARLTRARRVFFDLLGAVCLAVLLSVSWS